MTCAVFEIARFVHRFYATFGQLKIHLHQPMPTFFQLLFPKNEPLEGSDRFTVLRPGPLLSTIDKLEHRIHERFPESGLWRVCREFRQQAVESEAVARQLGKPIWPVRIFSLLLIGGLILLVGTVFWLVLQKFSTDGFHLGDLIGTVESAINELIFLGFALFFLISIETRLKRRVALRALHRLRSLAHVVDMHQLTKDPTRLLAANKLDTESSPERIYSSFELARYLDYCSEMLALMAKTAALFAQNMDDSVILASVNDLESLTQGLASKIWQKIMILDSMVERNE